MKKALEKLWAEYFAEECASIDTEGERSLLRKAALLRESVNQVLTTEQFDMIEKYIETLYENQALVCKKAFFKGCEFTASFLFEARDF